MENEGEGCYVCVNCGHSVKRLYKRYSPSVLKLCNCECCGNVADKYLEYDKVIVVIDMILLSKEAYRHVLFNLQYKSYAKLAILLLIVISLDEWFHEKKNSVKFQEGDFYESRFYLVCLSAALGKILYLFVILNCLVVYNYYWAKKKLTRNTVLDVIKAIVCSSFGYFLLLTILIWDDFQREINMIFIHVYILLSQIQALTVSTTVPRPVLGVICAFANASDQFLSLFVRTSI